MKWENCDTNVSKMKTILNFSKLDDIANFLKLFELIFDEAIVEMVNGYYKLYAHRDKGATSFEHFPYSYRKLPDRKMYWKTILDTFVL